MGRLVNTLQVPVLDLDASRWVEVGTAAVVVLGFVWVLWCLVSVGVRSGFGRIQTRVQKDEVVEEKKDI